MGKLRAAALRRANQDTLGNIEQRLREAVADGEDGSDYGNIYLTITREAGRITSWKIAPEEVVLVKQ
jgi:hypothetical protein